MSCRDSEPMLTQIPISFTSGRVTLALVDLVPLQGDLSQRQAENEPGQAESETTSDRVLASTDLYAVLMGIVSVVSLLGISGTVLNIRHTLY